MKSFKTFAEFKRVIQVGDMIHTIFHDPIWGATDLGICPISEIKTVGFSVTRTRTDGEQAESWLYYPKKSSYTRVEDNKLTLLKRDTTNFSGGLLDESNPEYAALPFIPQLEYRLV